MKNKDNNTAKSKTTRPDPTWIYETIMYAMDHRPAGAGPRYIVTQLCLKSGMRKEQAAEVTRRLDHWGRKEQGRRRFACWMRFVERAGLRYVGRLFVPHSAAVPASADGGNEYVVLHKDTALPLTVTWLDRMGECTRQMLEDAGQIRVAEQSKRS